MAEKTTVAFRVDESVKEDWEDAAEGAEYDSLSHLIRLAVQREITDTGSSQAEAHAGAEIAENSEVMQSLTRLERTVTDMQEELGAMGRESRAEELYDLEQVLLEVLPTTSQGLDPTTELESDQLKSGATTARDVAGRIGADTSDVVDALERLDENTAQVQSATHAETEEAYFWRVD